MDTVLIELTNQKAMRLLQELEELQLIKVLKKIISSLDKLSDKYRGIISKEEGRKLNEHIKQMRNEYYSENYFLLASSFG